MAEWKGPGTNWTILADTAFVEVTGRANWGKVIYAVGWDEKSVILKVFVGESGNITFLPYLLSVDYSYCKF